MRKGFIFSVDAIFAAVVGITLALSLFMLIEKAVPQPASNHAERDILAVLDKSGRFEEVTAPELAGLLSPYNKCGTLDLKQGGAVEKEISTCSCSDNSDVYLASRSYVKDTGFGSEYYIATLKACLR